ncbi:MAG: signal peptidase I, partial [Actinomycetota bacterium]
PAALEQTPVTELRRRGSRVRTGPDRHTGRRLLSEIVVVVAGAMVVSVLVRALLVQAFYVPSPSMEDTLLPSDRILASKLSTRLGGVNRGDIVVFSDPGGWLPPSTASPGVAASVLSWLGLAASPSDQDLVKRVIGVAGDRVACCDADGRILLNGKALDESYLPPGTTTDQVLFDVTVPAGTVFVMGDNRGDSRDSRYHLRENNGGVPLDDVVGQVVAVIWPADRWAAVDVPPTFDDIPSP